MLISDADLIHAVRQGDEKALQDLLQRYRPHAVRWAAGVVRDPHLAEDIVQDAMVQVVVKLEQLRDPTRFAAWLRRIVRRLALNCIKQRRRELLRTDLVEEPTHSRPSRAGIGMDRDDPIEIIAQQEWAQELVSGTLSALSPKAGAIMREVAAEAATEELMEQFTLTRGNLYNIISRSRVKAGDERFNAALREYLAERRRRGHPHAVLLAKPEWQRPYSMFGTAVHAALRYMPDAVMSITETMGVLGEAFRLSVANGCHWRGISTFDWTYTTQRAVERLGRKAVYFSRKRNDPITPDRHLHLLSLIHDSMDQGIPVVVWNLVINEFGLLYGYDDKLQILHYRGFQQAAKHYAYTDLGRSSEEPQLFALAIGKKVAPQATDSTIIGAIVKHAKGEEPPIPGFAFGLEGYRLWQAAAEQEALDPLGHSYQVAIMCEAREHAAAYLHLLSDRAKTPSRREGLAAAAQCYEASLHSLQRLYPSFPYGYGIGSRGGSLDRIIAQGIAAAYQAECEAINILERL